MEIERDCDVLGQRDSNFSQADLEESLPDLVFISFIIFWVKKRLWRHKGGATVDISCMTEACKHSFCCNEHSLRREGQNGSSDSSWATEVTTSSETWNYTTTPGMFLTRERSWNLSQFCTICLLKSPPMCLLLHVWKAGRCSGQLCFQNSLSDILHHGLQTVCGQIAEMRWPIQDVRPASTNSLS